MYVRVCVNTKGRVNDKESPLTSEFPILDVEMGPGARKSTYLQNQV